MNLKKFKFITKLEENYDNNPVLCYHCGKPLTFKKFYKQFEFTQKYCSKKCGLNYEQIIKREFKSETEKIIYTYLCLTYPQYPIHHNIVDLFPPYEIDMCIQTELFPIYFEFNGSLHFPKNGKLAETSLKHMINDKIKKNEICNNRQQKMIRLWSSKGLYNNPVLFEDCLDLVKDSIEYLLKANNSYGQCLDVVADSVNNKAVRYKEKFKLEDIIE